MKEITSSFGARQTSQEQEKEFTRSANQPVPSITQGPHPSRGAALLSGLDFNSKSEHLSVLAASHKEEMGWELQSS